MPVLSMSRQGESRSPNRRCALRIALSIFLFVGAASPSPGQPPKSAAPRAEAEPAAVVDPLGRETPRRAVMGLVKYSERQDFATAARYLQLPPGQDANLAELAKKFLGLHSRFKGNVDLLSDDPNGTVESGLPPGQARAGVFSV